MVSDLSLILYEDDYLIAVNKPAGLASVPAPNIAEKNTLMGQVQMAYREKGFVPYILHRLDRETSGVVLFGKFPRNRAKLENIFNADDTKKIYLALVKGKPRLNGIINFPLEARTRNKKVAAKTAYRVLQTYADSSLVEAEIKTGRHHQIRKHFHKIGHPLVNDFDYGDSGFNKKFQKNYGTHFMFLHAVAIEFKHPFTEKIINIKAPLSKQFGKML